MCWKQRIPLEDAPMTHAARTPASWRLARQLGRSETRVTPSCHRAVIGAEGQAGSVQFRLQRTAGGLYVEREDIPRRGLRTVQSLVFGDAASFERWCNDDTVRFKHPLLHAQVKRAGGQLWDGATGPG